MQSYLVPLALVGAIAWIGKPAWWATSMLAGGAMFAWDYLWGEWRVLDGRYGLKLAGVGLVLIGASLWLAHGLGVTLAEFLEFARYMRRREGVLYQLPAIGVGMLLYGLLVWSSAWARQRDE
ncbi:hypothetical protein [Ramlibacter pallidus]|uniref:Lycopene cyclase domain-containing protein n=1 Tax=Ramlibacter pallidus TaxID=2780087 RepID=A0ABR9S245_9BURK|nr:hypothetical protein [Ramlibacter pallidus]MBE7367174.1 hypothetical protein [Ramlibacter pallidus]